MIKPAIQGVLNVLKACSKAKTIKRVILTSSAAAVSINKLPGMGLVMDEKDWTDVEFLTSEKPPTWVGCYEDDFTDLIDCCLKSINCFIWIQNSKVSLVFLSPGLSLLQDPCREGGLEVCRREQP